MSTDIEAAVRSAGSAALMFITAGYSDTSTADAILSVYGDRLSSHEGMAAVEEMAVVIYELVVAHAYALSWISDVLGQDHNAAATTLLRYATHADQPGGAS